MYVCVLAEWAGMNTHDNAHTITWHPLHKLFNWKHKEEHNSLSNRIYKALWNCVVWTLKLFITTADQRQYTSSKVPETKKSLGLQLTIYMDSSVHYFSD